MTRTGRTCARFAPVALVGLTPAIAQLGTTTHHNNVDAYAIDPPPATRMAYRATQVLRADGPKVDL